MKIVNFLTFILFIGMLSCQSNTEDINVTPIKPGVYSTDIILVTEKGTENSSRSVDLGTGSFGADYDLDYIYLHVATKKENGTYIDSQSQRISLHTGECGDNICFNFKAEYDENGDCIITAGDNTPISLSSDQFIYFSTEEEQKWKAEEASSNLSPISLGQNEKIFDQPTEENAIKAREILISDPYSCKASDSSIRDLINSQYIDLHRHVTGFKVHVLFTNESTNTITSGDFTQSLSYPPECFAIKIYFGPNFCEEYDIINEESTGGGYYASNNQSYSIFQNITARGTVNDYQGYGYTTDNVLLSPLNLDYNSSDFEIYLCVKFNPNGWSNNNAPGTSNENAYFFRLQPEGISVDTNTTHRIILVFDVNDLEAVKTQTRSPRSTLRKIDIKPIKVICN